MDNVVASLVVCSLCFFLCYTQGNKNSMCSVRCCLLFCDVFVRLLLHLYPHGQHAHIYHARYKSVRTTSAMAPDFCSQIPTHDAQTIQVTDEGMGFMAIYKSGMPVSGTVTLGGNRAPTASGALDNYVVVVAPSQEHGSGNHSPCDTGAMQARPS
jgi:hypothetical protein